MDVPQLRSMLSSGSPYIYILFATAIPVLYYGLSARQLKFPPGPPGHFLVGHIFKIPHYSAPSLFAKWAKQYGNFLYLHILGRPVMVCNTFESASDLLDARGSIYSDRPPFPFADMLGWGTTMVVLGYGERWRRQRRLMQKVFDRQGSLSFRPYMQSEVVRLLKSISHHNGNIRHQVHRFVVGALSLAAYGHEVTSDDDELTSQIERVGLVTRDMGNVGAAILDFFPIPKYLPSWVPGAGYVNYLGEARERTRLAFVTPVNLVRKEKAAGISKDSFISQLLDDVENLGSQVEDYEKDIAALGGVIFLAGSETSVVTLYAFFLMMVLHPEVVAKAHKELDEFFDNSQRLPDFRDRGRLPYVDCIVKELFRVNPAAPLGVPHRLMEDDTYKGWSIPAGSLITANLWQMMRDERYYSDPGRFYPDRHLKPHSGSESGSSATNSDSVEAASDPTNIVFGFGRRKCPGQHFAGDIIWLTVANILTVFDILPPVDPVSGKEILPKLEFHSSTTHEPKPFACRVVPRQKYAALINLL